MRQRILRQRTQSGDTIIEVLIVLAVLGLAIGIAYATANRSLQNTRQALESSQATALLQTQLEQLRTMAANPATDPNRYIFNTASEFCIAADPSGQNYLVVPESNSANFQANCLNVDGLYDIRIEFVDDIASTKPGGTFVLKTDWDNVRGEGRDSASLTYKLYHP